MKRGGGGLARTGAGTYEACRNPSAVFTADGKWEVVRLEDGSCGAAMAGGGARPSTTADALAVAADSANLSSKGQLAARTSRGRAGDRQGAAERGLSALACNGVGATYECSSVLAARIGTAAAIASRSPATQRSRSAFVSARRRKERWLAEIKIS